MEEFSTAEIEEAAREGRLLEIEIELAPGSLAARRATALVEEAAALGARRLCLSGAWRDTDGVADLSRAVRDLGLRLEAYLGDRVLPGRTTLTALREAEARIVVDRHGWSDEIHQRVVGRVGAAARMRAAIAGLKGLGWETSRVGIAGLVCRANAPEIAELWRWIRREGYVPLYRAASPVPGEADAPSGPPLSPDELASVFERLARIDAGEFDLHWEPQPPCPARPDVRHRYACRVSSDGVVTAPGRIGPEIGSLEDGSLRDLVRESEVLEELRVHPESLKGPCRDCEKLPGCAGDRDTAYAITGDYLSSDPTCWRNRGREKQDRIPRLPAPLRSVLPQRPPMQYVDTLCSVGDRVGLCRVTIRDDMPFVQDGRVDDVAYFEMIAQAMAALQAWKHLGVGTGEIEGFLVGAQSLEVLGETRVGETLEVRVRKESRFGGYGIVRGTVSKEEHVVAQGEIKIWHKA